MTDHHPKEANPMIGLLNFSAATLLIILLPALLLLGSGKWLWENSKESRRGTIRWTTISRRRLIYAIVLIFLFESLLIPGYILQWQKLAFLQSLLADDVANIRIGASDWSEPNDIQAIVGALNQAEWFGGRGNNDGPFEPVTLTFRSGATIEFNVGRYSSYDGAIFEFPGTAHRFLWFPRRPVGLYIPGLIQVLEKRNYVLPGEPVLRQPLPKQTFILLAIGVIGFSGAILALGVGLYLMRREKNLSWNFGKRRNV
ncbi:MAG: hypothetical protein HC875_32040 [Anaerolineales bacterium]|nr:hypothetical protein [Anaerolineales bacterium]